jgi:predicted MPP superfamily phosphohydrolase
MKNFISKCISPLVFIGAAVFLLVVPWDRPSVAGRDLFAAALGPTNGNTVRLAAIGDTRSGDSRQQKIADLLVRVNRTAPLNGIILLGDNASVHGSPARAMEKTFFMPYESLIKEQAPFYAVLGNHDLRGEMKEYQLNFAYYNMNGRPYYSKVFGENIVEVFFLDSNTIRKDPQQVRWLEDALKQSTAPWKVVALHRPLYTTARSHPSKPSLIQLLEPILTENKVEIVLAGHNHIYERLYPIHGITYFTSGSGGELKTGNLAHDDTRRAAGNDTDNVALILEFTTETCSFLASTGYGNVVDEGTLKHANMPLHEQAKQNP